MTEAPAPDHVQHILQTVLKSVLSVYNEEHLDFPGNHTLRYLCEYYFAKSFPQWGEMWQVRIEHTAINRKSPEEELQGYATFSLLKVGNFRVSVKECVSWGQCILRLRGEAVEHHNPRDILNVHISSRPHDPVVMGKEPWNEPVETLICAGLCDAITPRATGQAARVRL